MVLPGFLVYVLLDRATIRVTDNYPQLLQGGLGVTAFVSHIFNDLEFQANMTRMRLSI